MHQVSTIHGLMSFFESLTDRLEADHIDQAQHDHLVSQELQGPTAPPPGRISARQFHEPLLDVPPDLDLVRPGRLGVVIQGRLESLGDEPLPDAGHSPWAGTQGRDNRFIGASPALRVVGQQKDVRMSQLARRGLSPGDQLLQRRPLLRAHGNSILLHRCPPGS